MLSRFVSLFVSLTRKVSLLQDYQGIATGFAGDGVAYPSDQGLFIVPHKQGPPDSPDACPNVRPGSPPAACLAATPLINANGDMTNNIAIKLSVAEGNGTQRYLVTSMWDWGPVASWDGGRSWPVGDWNPHAAAGPPDLSETAEAAVTVQLETMHSQVCGHDLAENFWLPVTALAELGIDPEKVAGCSKDKHGTNNTCGSVVINDGANLTLASINCADGQDACGFCDNCSLAFFSLERGERLASGLQPGAKVKMAWSPVNGPPAPPMPPPSPPGQPPGPHYPTSGAPARFGEGGAAHSLGESNHVIMIHYNNIYTSMDGGQNLSWFHNCSARTPTGACKGQLSALPAGAIAHESNLAWTRKVGSRTKPDGTVYTIMTIRNVSDEAATEGQEQGQEGQEEQEEQEEEARHLSYTRFGELRDHAGGEGSLGGSPPLQYLLKSSDFGYTWSWTVLPPQLQGGGKPGTVAVDPTDPSVLFVVSLHCMAVSRNKGETFSDCIGAVDDPEGPKSLMTSLHIKDQKTMILLRQNAAPLRSRDGGTSWAPLGNFPNVTSPQYSRNGEYSWSGETFVVYGRDPTAPARGQFPTYVVATTDDGETWADWVGDLVTMSPSSAVWWDKDFYLSSAGEGIMVKRGAEPK